MAVQISDLDLAGGPWCFNGSTFTTTCPNWLAAQGTVANWTYNSASFPFTNDRRYKMEAKAIDYAGNYLVNSVTIKYDIEKPTSTITYPLSGITTGFSQLTGTASDERVAVRNYEASLGTYTIKVAIKRVNAPAGWWNQTSGNFGASNPVWYEVYNATNTGGGYPTRFSYSLTAELKAVMADPLNEGATYWFVPWAYDLAQNREFGA
ncbi:MAG: hypothetical protein NTX59_01575, partial [Elusimicrobia bacterium]|nr:hypothetical protein [Elusimicrobiota bacterium]